MTSRFTHPFIPFSGCVTTAETILIEAQSVKELLEKLSQRTPNSIFVVSTSPQVISSISAATSLPPNVVYLKLNALFRDVLKADFFFDTNFSRDISLFEQAHEFIARFKEGKDIPMIASSCPGWVCYAEKSLGDLALPLISTTKSPQQIMGSLVKTFLPNIIKVRNPDMNVLPSDIYHVTLMPCFDKKLEASRSDFLDKVYNTNDVDLVLTSTEIPNLLEELNVDFMAIPMKPIESLFNNVTEDGFMMGQEGVSGGFAEYIFKFAARHLYQQEVENIEMKTLRNNDFKEFSLQVNGETVLSFATAYGFRNIQNIVRQLKQKRCKYHYIEIMACPSGCVNGGGQVKAIENYTANQWLKMVSEQYKIQVKREPEQNPFLEVFYKTWIHADPFTDGTKQLLHTQYHEIPPMKDKNPLTIQW